MKFMQAITLVLLMCFSLNTALAGSMRCGTHLIDEGDRPLREEVEEKCGPPDSNEGDSVYYKKNNVRYKLHFNENDELLEVTEDVE